MKKIISALLILFSVHTGFSQTATSIANGNWMNPSTWSCTCVPLPGYTVTINHAVALDTSWYVPSGGITINSGGSLIKNNSKRDLLINGGNLINHGTLDVRNLFTQAGTFSNTGVLTARAFLNYVNFTNTGTIHDIDSLYSTGGIINTGSFLNIDSITTGGTFTNNGACTYNQFTNTGHYTNNNNLSFTDFSNLGTFTNTDTIICQHNIWNAEKLINQSTGFFLLQKSFLNGDSIQHNAMFNNNGRMVINDSWYNSDTVKGSSTGSFRVADSSVNWGWMLGTFDFCDLTPPASAPYVDINTGTLQIGITWCNYTGIADLKNMEIKIYPNPASDFINVEMKNQIDSKVRIYNSCGSMISEATNKTRIDISEYPSGLYFISILTGNNSYTKKIQIIK